MIYGLIKQYVLTFYRWKLGVKRGEHEEQYLSPQNEGLTSSETRNYEEHLIDPN